MPDQIPKSTYRTSDPTIVEAWTSTAEKIRDMGNAAVAGAEAIGKNRGLMVQRSLGNQRFVGLSPVDPKDPPAGWRYVREQFEPRLGKPGAGARKWLADHQPPSMRKVMAEHGLPEMTSFKYGFMGVPGMFLHDGTVWAIYKGEPDREPGPAWIKCKPSEFYAAQERNEEAEKGGRGGDPMTDTQHFLIVTADPNEPGEVDYFSYGVYCPGVTDACRRYEDCVPDGPEKTLLDNAADEETVPMAHGVKHLKIDGVWCAATDLCNVRDNDGLPDAVAGRFPTGRHAIDFDFGEGTEIGVYASDPADVAAIR